MSVWERLAWGVPFGLLALLNVLAWYRDERQIKQIQRAHEAEMAHIREVAEVRGICGDTVGVPLGDGVLICDLPADHRGWHSTRPVSVGLGPSERTSWQSDGAGGRVDA